MSGGPDPLYVRARTALLDAAEALAEQLDAVVLVGAQAVYLHTGDADFVAPYTTDADFCVAPADLNVRRGKALCPSGCESRPATVAPAGSSRSGARRQRIGLKHSDGEGSPVGDSASAQAAT